MSGTSPPSARDAQWRATHPEFADQLKHIFATGDMSDVQFTVGRQYGDVKTFSAHKFVLSLASDVFNTMFNGCLHENGDGPIDIPEILPEAFANMLKYLYTRSVDGDLNPENVLETIYCADKYNLPQLLELCMQFVNTHLNADNCLIFLEKVKYPTHDCLAGLLTKCLAVVDANCSVVLQSKHFTAIGQDTLELILQSDVLCAEENVIYTAAEKWAMDACARDNLEPSQTNRRHVLGKALFLVRFPLLTDAQLANGPVKSRLLLDTELLDIYQFKHSDTKPQLPFPTKPRLGSLLRIGYSEFTYNAKVFADVNPHSDYWWPAEVVGISGVDFLITRNEWEAAQQCAPHKIVLASDILKEDQPVIARYGSDYWKGVYVRRSRKTGHVVNLGAIHLEWSCPFNDLRINRPQMATWKAALAQQMAPLNR
ncbi:BTB/POZ domain-containing protein 6-B-like isoform X2 [Paramacrobiotus metropolitanus]|uniref:BTB/POZ domain-containing protein 6-B-like isoform X2 n=1 Tax=Paramacrobiotus metropolitanus TaxID=2943436 RepID=UPI002446524B|nr:BTB/POZ domain-containing protein 6-B-like isoform X2 [Paramacrobiotus metropolitanus]